MKIKNKLLTIIMIALASTLLIFTACEEEPNNSAPTCTITSPEAGAEFTQGETITIAVDAVDEDENLNEVRFYVNDVGIGSASSFSYNFDWDTSVEEPGSFTIKAEAIDEAQKKASDEITISLTPSGSAPVAALTANQTNITEGETVNFTDQSTNDPTSWSWDFGDGNTSAEVSPSHTYNSAGSFTIELTVTNDYGSDTETKTNYITVEGGGTGGTVTDIDGNVYSTGQIGDQVWMAENLKTTTYNNGTSIDLVTDNTAWDNNTTGAFCWYDNDQATYADAYGALYNWYAVNTGNLCPDGWHIPTDAEWRTLEMHLGMSQAEAYDTGWRGTNEGSKLAGNAGLWYNGVLETDSEFGSSGFTALPGGYRYINGYYYGIGNYGRWWSATEDTVGNAWGRSINYSYSNVYKDNYNKDLGFSVRCVRDN